VQVLEAFMEGVREALGKNSIMLDPLLRDMRCAYLPEIQIDQENYFPSIVSDHSIMATESFTVRSHAIINAAIEPNHWARKTHLLVKFKDRQAVAYAIDESLLHEKNAEKMIEQQISRMLAAAFMQYARKGRL